jgi:ribosome-associated protein
VADWILIDFVDVVVHVFQDEKRWFYGLERLWGDAKRVAIEGATTSVPRTLRRRPGAIR